MVANLPEKNVLIEFIEAYTLAQISKNEKLIKYATDELLQLIEKMYVDEAANLPEKKVLIEFIEAYTLAQISKNEKLIKYATDELLSLIEKAYADEVELSPVSLVD